MGIKLRYDLAAEAISNLQKYLETCAEEENIIVLLDHVQDSLDELVLIEADIRQRRGAGEVFESDVMSALAEVDARINAVKEKVEPFTQFVNEYRTEINAVKAAFHAFADINAVVSGFRSLEKQMDLVRQRVTLI